MKISLSEDEKLQALKVAFTTPVWKLVSAYNENRDAIHQSLGTREGYTDYNDDMDTKAQLTILGLTGAVLFFAMAIAIGLWIWGLVLLIRNYQNMPTWAVVVAVLGLLGFIGPLLTIIVVYVTRGKRTTGGTVRSRLR